MSLWNDLAFVLFDEEYDGDGPLTEWGQWLKGHEVTICNVSYLGDEWQATFSSRQPVAVAVKLAYKYIREAKGGEPIRVDTDEYADRGYFSVRYV